LCLENGYVKKIKGMLFSLLNENQCFIVFYCRMKTNPMLFSISDEDKCYVALIVEWKPMFVASIVEWNPMICYFHCWMKANVCSFHYLVKANDLLSSFLNERQWYVAFIIKWKPMRQDVC
jgi:hypothetical protein